MAVAYRNILLRRMQGEDLALITPWLERVELKKLEVISAPGRPKEFVYFPEEGILSVISHLDEQRDVELGVIGREGMSGVAVVLRDDRSPFTVHVEMPGQAMRLPSKKLKEALRQSESLHDLLLRYVRAQYLQLSSTAASIQRGSVEERVARWILMGFDRVDWDTFKVTHDSLAWIIGVRRPSVTEALHSLEGRGLIRSTRGQLTVLDPQGLREAASGSYGLAESEYARLVGEDFRGTKKSVSPMDAPEFFTTRTSDEDVG